MSGDLTPDQISAARRATATAQHERGERMAKRLFMSDGECHLRAQAHTEASRAGVVFHRDVRRHADAVVAAMRPVLEETTLTGPEVLDLRKAQMRPPHTKDQRDARRADFIQGMRSPIYGTKAKVEAKAEGALAAANQSTGLRKSLAFGQAPESIPLARALYRRTTSGEPILRKPTSIIK